jgi:hypothetical protein
MLSVAAQRDDRCLVPAPKLKGAAQKIAGKLIAAGLVKEIKAKAGVWVWRRDDETGQSGSRPVRRMPQISRMRSRNGCPVSAIEISSPPAPIASIPIPSAPGV